MSKMKEVPEVITTEPAAPEPSLSLSDGEKIRISEAQKCLAIVSGLSGTARNALEARVKSLQEGTAQ